MKKKLFSMLMLCMAGVVMGVSFISCGNDDDDPKPVLPPDLPAKIAIGYSLDLGDGWWKFFDIEVTYTTAEGTTETKTIQKGWVYLGKVDYKDAVTEYTFTAKATPKTSLTEIDENATYNFDKTAEAYAFSLNEKEEQIDLLVSKNSSSTMSIAGSNISRWLKEHTNLGAGTMTVKK